MRHIDTVPACDGQTDRQTDGRTDEFTTASRALCIASYSDALLLFDSSSPRHHITDDYLCLLR